MSIVETQDDSRIRRRSPGELTLEFVQSWRNLSDRAFEPNIFLDPDFLIPLWEHLPPAIPVQILSVEAPGSRLALAACVQPIAWSPSCPFPHLTDFQSPYKFRGGLLVQTEDHAGTLSEFFAELSTSSYRHGLHLQTVRANSPLSQAQWQAATESGFLPVRSRRWLRAALDRTLLNTTDLLQECCSKSRRKSLRQARRKLEQQGEVTFRAVRDSGEVLLALERFLALEQQGWKQEAGTAIGCREADRRFFEEMVLRLSAREKVLFGELSVGDRVIASTCNLLAGNTLFAFKIGWDQEFAAGSPGTWAEIELVNWTLRHLPQIRYFDSCSRPGSYLEAVWPHRLIMGDLGFVQSRRSRIFLSLRSKLRTAKRQIVTSIDDSDPFALLEPLGLS